MKQYYAIIDTVEVISLGEHEDFDSANDEAYDRNPESLNWIVDENDLRELLANITKMLVP